MTGFLPDPRAPEPSNAEPARGAGTDLRTPLLGATSWAGALAAFLLPGWAWPVAGALGLLVLLAVVRRHGRGRRTAVVAACLLAGTAVAAAASFRVAALQRSPVADLADEHAVVTAMLEVSSDARTRPGRFEPYVLVRARVTSVTGRGRTHTTRVPVLVIADPSWARVRFGSRLEVTGRLSPADGDDLAAVLSTSRAPRVRDPPGSVLGAAAAVRTGIRASVSHLGPAERTLIPALVDGDDQGMPADLVEDFRVSGLTHLTAVSGTNLTLLVGFLLILARWVGVRARGLVLVGALGVAGFVLLARTEPSVVRAAAMGSVGLLGMGSNGRQQGPRALGFCVFALLLFDPWLATSVGFVLSALATAGIVFLAPSWRDRLHQWMPRWLAEAVAVPCAAQLAATPVVAAISGKVSLVAVAANMLAAPVVGPATVAGLAGGLASTVTEPLGRVPGTLAGGCGWWIVEVAHRSAALPGAALDWPVGPVTVTLLVLGCLTVAALLPVVFTRPGRTSAGCAALVLVVVLPTPTPGWPPAGWVMVACHVGQGDGLVLNAAGQQAGDGAGDGAVDGAGEHAAVVVDTGPDPAAMGRCLDRLDVHSVPVLVLTHFHADHVDGLSAVLDGHDVGRIVVSPLAEPEQGAREVRALARAARVPVRVARVGARRRVGPLRWQVLGPRGVRPGPDPQSPEGSGPNNASVVLLVESRGLRLLLAGDVEPEAQQDLARAYPGLRVDVLKVPHHGSAHQDPAFLRSLHARIGVVSVGVDNDYGHPAPRTMDLVRESGALLRRTDVDGDVAVLVRDGALRVRTRMP